MLLLSELCFCINDINWLLLDYFFSHLLEDVVCDSMNYFELCTWQLDLIQVRLEPRLVVSKSNHWKK